jgi:RHS repeat-associated protein
LPPEVARSGSSEDPSVVAELTQKRTAHSREFQLSDGTRRIEVSLLPVNYKDADGAWQTIDCEISPSSKNGFTRENAKNSFRSYFSGDGTSRGTIGVEDGAFSLEIAPVSDAKVSGSPTFGTHASKDKVEYADLFPETAARYTVMPGMLKEELVLANAGAPTVFQFRIDASQLSPVAQEDGSIIFFDSVGIAHFVLLQPYAEDSAEDPAFVNLRQTIRQEGKNYLYEVVVDPEWLNDPARVFPVVIDPTITTEDMAVDTYISNSSPTTSYSSSYNLQVKGTGTGAQEDTLVRFNLPVIDNGPAILYAGVSLCRGNGSASGTNTVHAYQITSDWTTAVTWNTRPSRSTTADSDTSADGAMGWYTFDITPSATQWYEAGASNYGVQLVSTGVAGGPGNTRYFVSRNDPQGPWPQLTIDYTYEDPRHSTYDLGEFAGHHSEATLDDGYVRVGTTDLAIASWGPAAVLSRHFCATYQDSRTAPGWFFNFDRGFTQWDIIDGDTEMTYRDEAGEGHVFMFDGTSWRPPKGMIAALVHSGSNWVLTFKDRTVLTFDSTGKLVSEADRNGNTTTYAWTYTYDRWRVLKGATLKITAANGQYITVTLSGSGSLKVTQATYTTSLGTRQVVYSTTAPWSVGYVSGTGLARGVTYTISDVYVSWTETDHYLTSIKATGYTSLVGDAQETFVYDGSYKLVEARLPDYASSVPNYNSSNTDARVTFARVGRSCTVTRWGAVRTSAAPTGATGTAITQVFSWNGRGTLDGRTNPKSSGSDQSWSYTYTNGTGWLTSETSPLGKTRSWTYDSRGNVLTQTDELSQVTSYTYPTSDTNPNRDLPLTVTSPSGAVTTYTYDTLGNVTRIERMLNQNATDNLAKTTYTYANVTVGGKTYYRALTQTQKLITGNTWAVTDYNLGGYYSNGAPAQVVYQDVLLEQGGLPVDLTSTSTYDAFGNLLTKTDTSGQVVETNVYDLAGRVTQSTSAPFAATVDGSPITTQVVAHNTYDNWGHLTATYLTSTADTSGAKVNWQTMTYDASGRASAVTSRLWTSSVPAGQVQSVITYQYDGKGRRITAADSTMSGLPALSAYDAIGNVVASWAAGVASYADSKADRALMADGVTPAFDAVGNALRATAAGNSAAATSTYTDDNRALRTTAPDGTWVEYTYDNLGSVTDTLRSNSATSGATYDMGGRCISATGENGLVTSLTYDCFGRATSARAGGQAASTTTYNSLGWALASMEADGTTASGVYDHAGRVLEATVADDTSTATYDTAGNLTHQVDPGDRWTDTYYDLFGRVCRATQTLPGTPRITVKDRTAVFDSLSRPTNGADNLQELASSWSYPLNTPSARTQILTVGSGGDQAQTTLTIGADGLETSRQTVVASSPQAPTLLRTIDTRDDGQRVTKTTLNAGGSSAIVSQYSYDAVGRLKRQWGTTGGGSGYTTAAQTTDAYGYDLASGLKTSENICLAAVGTAGTITSSYAYSADGRLASATTNGYTVGYAFDALGNLTTISPQGQNPTTLTYDSGNRPQTALNAAGNTYFSWDTVKGRRTSQGSTTNELDPRIRYTYTETGRLASYTNETVSPAISATYSHDAAGQRAKSTVTVGSQTTISTLAYAGLALATVTASQSGGVENHSWQFTYLYTGGGRPYAAVYRDPSSSSAPVVFGIVANDRGDVLELLDAAGNPFAAYRYDAWGNPQGTGSISTGVWSQATSLTGAAMASDIASRQPLRYAGYYYDSESGLYYLSARTYDPRTGQFLTKDPVKSDGEESGYQYCAGDPVDYIDPTGMDPYQESYPTERESGWSDTATLAEIGYWWAQGLMSDWDSFNYVVSLCDLSDPVVLNALFDMFDVLYYKENGPYPGDTEGVVGAAASGNNQVGPDVYFNTVTVANIGKYGSLYLKRIMRACAEWALKMTEGMDQGEKDLWSAWQFREGGPWDFKLLPGAMANGKWVEFKFLGGKITMEEFGNYLIGYVGNAIGFNVGHIQEGSWWAHVLAGGDTNPNSPGYQNEMTDEDDIERGYSLWPLWKNNNWPYPYLYYYHRPNVVT